MAAQSGPFSPEVERNVVDHCLHGRPMPIGLKRLWLARSQGDDFFADTLGVDLYTSLGPLQSGYVESAVDASPGVSASVRAHRRVFDRLGFFAGCHEWSLAFDFESGAADDPPVVELDSEGTYRWAGANLAEAMVRASEYKDPEAATTWLASHGIVSSPLAQVGASTQFLPSIEDLFDRYYHQELGSPRPEWPTATEPASPHDLMTWMLRPAAEVDIALRLLLNVPETSPLDRNWVESDADGRVSTIWVQDRPKPSPPAGLRVGKLALGMTLAQAQAVMGTPSKVGDGIAIFPAPFGRVWTGFDGRKLNEFCLMVGPGK